MNFHGNDQGNEQQEDEQEQQCMLFSFPKKKKVPQKTSIDMIREEITLAKDDECSIELENPCSLENIEDFQPKKKKNKLSESDILENQQEEENIKKNQKEGEWGIESLSNISNSIQEEKKKEDGDDDENIITKSMERVDNEEEKEEEVNITRQTSLPVGQNLLKAFKDAKKVQKLVKQATMQSKKSDQKQNANNATPLNSKKSKKRLTSQSLLTEQELLEDSDLKIKSLKETDEGGQNKENSIQQEQQQQFPQQQQPQQLKNLEVIRQVSLPVNILQSFAEPNKMYNNEIQGLIEETQQSEQNGGNFFTTQNQQQQQQQQSDQPNFSFLANLQNMPKFNIDTLFNADQQAQQLQQQQQQQQQFSHQQFASPPNLSKSPDFPQYQIPNYQLNEQQLFMQNQQSQFPYNPTLPRSQSGLQTYQYDYYYAQKQQQQQQQQQQYQQQQQLSQYQQQSLQNYIFFKNNNSNTKQEKRKPLVLNESRDKYYGTVKFFDEHRLYGFIILDFDNSEIFFHMDDVVSPKVTKEYIATYKSGNIIRFKFSLMTYIGKYNQSRKATELELVKLNEMYQQ